MSARIAEEFNVTVPVKTVQHWSYRPEARELITPLREQLWAMVDERSHAVVPKVYDKLEAPLDANDAKAADALSRTLVNLTRGVVADRHEITPTPAVMDRDELAEILARHSVTLPERPVGTRLSCPCGAVGLPAST